MQKRTFRFEKNQKLSLVCLLMLTTCFEFAKASNQLSYGSPAFLGDKFTGSGQMSLANAVKKLIPHDIKVLFMDVDPNTVTRWSYSDAYVLNVITDFSKKYRFNWELIDNKLLIVGQNAQLPDKSDHQGMVDMEHHSANLVALSKTSSSPSSPVGKTVSVKEIEPIQEIKRFEIRLEDESLSLAIRRWSSENGYQLVWDVDKDFPAIQTNYSDSTYLAAIGNVMHDIAKTNYPLHTCVYNNKVVRVLPLASPCERATERETAREN